MPLFPSAAWVQAFCDRFVAHPNAADAVKTLEGAYRFVIEPGGPLQDRHVYDLGIAPDGDAGASAVVLDDPPERPRLELRADYTNWRRLIEGQLDIGMALMLRRIRVSGDLAGLTRNLSSARPLTDALGAVDTTWLEASGDRS